MISAKETCVGFVFVFVYANDQPMIIRTTLMVHLEYQLSSSVPTITTMN